MTKWLKTEHNSSCVVLGTFIMDPRIKYILVDNISSEWKRFARHAVFDKLDIDHINLDKYSDQHKMKKLLKMLVLRNPSDFMSVVEKSLTLMSKTDILNEIQMYRKCTPLSNTFLLLHVFFQHF